MTKGKLLTQEQVDALAEGTEVWIRWSGGNGPWMYTVGKNSAGGSVAEQARCDIDFVGDESYSTQVWLVEKK